MTDPLIETTTAGLAELHRDPYRWRCKLHNLPEHWICACARCGREAAADSGFCDSCRTELRGVK
jgi:predicted amidophosphoribosyltransferase